VEITLSARSFFYTQNRKGGDAIDPISLFYTGVLVGVYCWHDHWRIGNREICWLSQYVVRQLSQGIKNGEIKDIEGAFFSSLYVESIELIEESFPQSSTILAGCQCLVLGPNRDMKGVEGSSFIFSVGQAD